MHNLREDIGAVKEFLAQVYKETLETFPLVGVRCAVLASVSRLVCMHNTGDVAPVSL